jgi:hypothetical protein
LFRGGTFDENVMAVLALELSVFRSSRLSAQHAPASCDSRSAYMRAVLSLLQPGKIPKQHPEGGPGQSPKSPLNERPHAVIEPNGPRSSVLNLKFSGLQIDSMIADPPDFGEGWLWVDGLLRWS